MARKAPRRTAERILQTSLALFNRYGEPSVSTAQISGELNISPGNLYYHFPAKDVLVNALFDQYVGQLNELLPAAPEVSDVENAWFFLHALFERVWEFRFLYRDINHLLSNNRHLEQSMKNVLLDKTSAFKSLLQGLSHSGVLSLEPSDRDDLAVHMVVMLTWWLSYEYVRDPRHAMADEYAQRSVLRGALHVMGLLLPHLDAPSRAHLRQLRSAYMPDA